MENLKVKYKQTYPGVMCAFSVAAYLKPEILLIDEVLAVVDIEFQKNVLEKWELE